jgi:hypothetical protein
MIEHADPEGGGKFTSRNRKSTGTRSASCLPKERGHWTETGAAVRRWTGTGKRITRNGVKSVKRNRSTASTKRDHEQHNWNKKLIFFIPIQKRFIEPQRSPSFLLYLIIRSKNLVHATIILI